LTESELAWLRQLPEHILVVVDEAYFEFSQRTTIDDVLQRPNWVVLRTFSKAFRLAAFRVGYAVSNP
jgi:histidinol-phosphate aminotransferase